LERVSDLSLTAQAEKKSTEEKHKEEILKQN
jgi:hypothetical protein